MILPENLPNTSFKEVAIIILNWNGKTYLQQFLPSVLAATYPNKRIILADNASTDKSVFFVQQNFSEVEVIVNKQNDGFAGGYNWACSVIQSDYYVLLNSDVEVEAGWLEPIIALMESNQKIAACQPKILQYAARHSFEYAGASGGWIDQFGYPFARGRIFHECETDKGQYEKASKCFWATGAAMVIKATAYHEAGGLDELFFAHQEEIDLCWTLQELGYEVWVQPASVVYHVGGGTLPKSSVQKIYLNFRNNLAMLYKHLPIANLIWIMPIRVFLDAVAAYRELFKGNGAQFIAIARAHFSFTKWVFTKKLRKKNRNRGTSLDGFYKGSIVLDYFVKGKKTFTEILNS